MLTAIINLDDDGFRTLRIKWDDNEYVELIAGNARMGYRRNAPGLGPYPPKVWHWSKPFNMKCYDYPMVFAMEEWEKAEYPPLFAVGFDIYAEQTAFFGV